ALHASRASGSVRSGARAGRESGDLMAERPLLVFVSDIHLTDRLHGTAVSKAEQLARFWERIAAVRGKRPAEFCVVGDLFDLVRSPTWFEGRQRPYHGATTNGVVKQVEHIVEETLRSEERRVGKE